MDKSRSKLWILLCGIVISTVTPLCHAQDTGALPEAIKPQTVVSPVFLPKTISTPLPLTAEPKPSKESSELPWYWRLLEGLTMGAAKYNTEKHNDGRPNPLGNLR